MGNSDLWNTGGTFFAHVVGKVQLEFEIRISDMVKLVSVTSPSVSVV